MSQSTISTFQLFALFPNEKAARKYTEKQGISSLQLSKEIGITQKSTWFMLRRIREACGNELAALRGIVGIDEIFIDGKEHNKHSDKKSHAGRGTVGKTAVIGMRERGKGGRTKAKSITSTGGEHLSEAIHANVMLGSVLHTDEHRGYQKIAGVFEHNTVNHGVGEYVRDDVTTNGIESVWTLLKRGIHGVYHHTSDKHLSRYINEFTFRLNDGNISRRTMQRLEGLVNVSFGQRLTYAELTA